MKIIQKALKQPLQHVNFQNFSGEKCPRTLLELFLFLNQLRICFAEKKKKIHLKKCRNYAPPPPPFKISRYATAMVH